MELKGRERDNNHDIGGDDVSGLNEVIRVFVEGPLIMDGLLQTAGAITFVVGMNSRKKVVVQNAAAAVNMMPRVRFGGDRILIEG
jgi:hypothetical protein